MKSVVKKIKANVRPIIQIIVLIIIGVFPERMNICNLVNEEPVLKASQNISDYILFFVWKQGNIAIGILLAVIVLMAMRKFNEKAVFNNGDEYKNYPYIWYWICAKVLSYSECNLVLVPIYMQFKLVIRDTFKKYKCGSYPKKENDEIEKRKINFYTIADEVNLMISDTYELNENQIPILKIGKPTIIISRNNSNDHNRYDSLSLVQAVVNEVRGLPSEVKTVNVYATTNPLNTMNIVSEAFKLGERGNIDSIVVFQQSKNGNPRMFEDKGKKVK